jgi:hypothetical protein
VLDFVMERCSSDQARALLSHRNRAGKLAMECASNDALSSNMSAWSMLLNPTMMSDSSSSFLEY